MDVLCEWYQTSCDNHMTNRKECTLTPGMDACALGICFEQNKLKLSDLFTVKRPPVVIIIEDFEAFSSQVLQDLIASLRYRTFNIIMVCRIIRLEPIT